jgi:hypothetical protein
MLKVTVDIFSGRPNPSWVIDEKDAKPLLKEIIENKDAIADSDSGFQGLGYRGIILEPLTEERMDEYFLPPRFAIANGASRDELAGTRIAKDLVKSMLQLPLERIIKQLLLHWIAIYRSLYSAS